MFAEGELKIEGETVYRQTFHRNVVHLINNAVQCLVFRLPNLKKLNLFLMRE